MFYELDFMSFLHSKTSVSFFKFNTYINFAYKIIIQQKSNIQIYIISRVSSIQKFMKIAYNENRSILIFGQTLHGNTFSP